MGTGHLIESNTVRVEEEGVEEEGEVEEGEVVHTKSMGKSCVAR